MTYVLHYRNGKVIKGDRGLSFCYWAPKSSIVAIPMGITDLPFVFKELTSDYQTVNIQGQISYRIVIGENKNNIPKLANLFDFTVNDNGQYKKNDIEKLNRRIINEVQTAISLIIHKKKLVEAIRSAKEIEEAMQVSSQPSQGDATCSAGNDEGTTQVSLQPLQEAVGMPEIKILRVNILTIQATPEITRALETATKEELLRKADEAVYGRRKFTVEKEGEIKETELDIKIKLETKQKQANKT
ncbi:MAG: SPFH domain-containing protein [Bacteroidetes bacterium]|nr:SPFH domain-containing protein [Bacteroidota bacterium]